MTESTTYSIESFVEFLRKNNFSQNQKLSKFSDIVKFFENSLGGCGCNRDTRVQFSNDFYKNFIKDQTSPEDATYIKELTFSKKIIFIDNNNFNFKEF
jgi:hypothetical protein